MNYPEQILPQPNFRIIIDDLSTYLITRKFNLPVPLTAPPPFPDEDLLGLSKPSDCFDYSTNLPGIYEVDFNKIELIGENKKILRAYWDQVSQVLNPVLDTDFVWNEGNQWFFLPIDKINSLKVPFKKGDSNIEQQAQAIVIHTPTNCNFWHFSIRWKTGTEFIRANDSTWQKSIIATIRASLVELIEWECPIQKIPIDYYVNN